MPLSASHRKLPMKRVGSLPTTSIQQLNLDPESPSKQLLKTFKGSSSTTLSCRQAKYNPQTTSCNRPFPPHTSSLQVPLRCLARAPDDPQSKTHSPEEPDHRQPRSPQEPPHSKPNHRGGIRQDPPYHSSDSTQIPPHARPEHGQHQPDRPANQGHGHYSLSVSPPPRLPQGQRRHQQNGRGDSPTTMTFSTPRP